MPTLRCNGARDMTGPELKVFKRLVAGGHSNEAIGDMLGRSTRSVRGLRDYYKLTDPNNKGAAAKRFSPEEYAQIDRRIIDWIEGERLSCKQMASRLKVLHPPGLHWGTIHERITNLGPIVKAKHTLNMRSKKSRSATRQAVRRRAKCRSK